MFKPQIPRIILIIAVLTFFVIASYAEIPNNINYQGRLTDSGGTPLTGTYSITFTIYDAASGGNSKWTETQSTIAVTDGLFNVVLGSVNPIPDTVFDDDVRYLGIAVGADTEISPRIKIVSSAYAYHALRADTALYALEGGGDFVKKTGDTISGHLYFDDDGLGKDAELLLFNDLSILNMYQGGTKSISLESEFATIILRDPDGDYSVRINGGEDPENDGGMIRIFNAHGASQMSFDGGQTGDLSVALPENAINADEIINEPGIASSSIVPTCSLGTSVFTDIQTISITIPAAGYIYLTGMCYIKLENDTAETNGAMLQIDETEGGYPSNAGIRFSVPLSVTDKYRISASADRVYYKDAPGTYEFRLEGRRYVSSDADTWAYNGRLTAIYLPTSYASVMSVVSDPGDNPDAIPIEITDEDGNSTGEIEYDVDLRYYELKAKQKKIEALEAELDLQKAREAKNK